ncbi:hypothetical protein CASFOL_006785 [Castilleja foliolosa]|uniref:F-box domain-containing protein n=1 Tax=Castilleja foliolosa TaxID=1961234 RepID=A0ABD3E7X4_9LAMI
MEKTPQEIVASIDDLLTEILIRLPLKSLFRFKQVSKHWQSLITDPGFAIRRNPISKPVGMFVPRCMNKTTFSRFAYVPFSNKKPKTRHVKQLDDVKIINSCNGLLLCYRNLTNSISYLVYNPTTNKSSTIPDDGVQSNVLGMSLAFDPARSRHYKIVRVRGVFVVDIFEYRIEVYLSESGCWRKPDGPFRALVNFSDGVYWNGAIHWVNYKTRDCLYFNPNDDDRMVMPRMAPSLPSSSVEHKRFYFGESCGHLNYVEFLRPGVCSKVYELRRDYSEWFFKYNFDLLIIYRGVDYMKSYENELWWSCKFSSIIVVRGEKDEDSFIVFIYSGKIVVRYNFVQGTCEMIGGEVVDYEKKRFYDKLSFSQGFQYIESLCAINTNSSD